MDEIEKAWVAGDFVTVRAGLKRLAEEAGTPFAQYRYGRVLLEGRGGPQDMMAAHDWFEQAVAQDQMDAAVILARMYLSTTQAGPARNPERAAVLFRMAAARGKSEAQYYLGLLYGKGTGVPQDPVEALAWFQAAAEQGHVAAQFELSRAYAQGSGTTETPAKALYWMREAAQNGHSEAQYFLAYALDSGQGVARNQPEALGWLRRSAEANFLNAQVALGRKYLRGDGVDPNAQEALRWLGQSVNAGSLEAMLVLGLALKEGNHLPADPAKAGILLERVASAGVNQGSFALGQMFEQGLGQPADLAQAVKLYRQAETQGSREASLHLGQLAIAGVLDDLMAPQRMVPWVSLVIDTAAEDAEAAQPARTWLEVQAEAGGRSAQSVLGQWLLSRDPAAAALWLQQAAEAGDGEAQHQLGRLYIQGEGVEQDYVAAHKWLNVAAAGGSSAALETRALVADLMTPEQVAEAQTAARVFFADVKSGAGSDGRPEVSSDGASQ